MGTPATSSDVFDQIAQPKSSSDVFDQLDSSRIDPVATAKPRTALDAVKNVGKGFWDTMTQGGQGLINMVRHPLDTLGSMNSAQAALYQKATNPKTPHLDAARAALEYMVPGLGPAIDTLGTEAESGKPGAIPHALGGAAALGLQTAAPEAIAARAPVATAAATASKGTLPERLYQSALNPRITTDASEVRSAVRTGLQNKIPVSEAGVAKLNSLMSDLNNQINQRLQPAAAAGVTISPRSVAARLNDVEKRVRSQVNPEADVKAVEQSGNEFLRSRGAKPGTPATPPQPTGVLDAQGNPIMSPGKPGTPATQAAPIPVDEAQALKVGTYAKLRGKYGEMATDAQVESQKALARGLKEEITDQIPELADLNEKQGGFFDLQGPLESAVNKALNRSGRGAGLMDLATGGAVGTVTGSGPMGMAAGVLHHILQDPALRSRIAIAINEAHRRNPVKWGPASITKSAARVDGYVNGLANAVESQKNAPIQQIYAPAQAESGEKQPTAYKTGDIVTLKNGQRVTVRKLNEDGSYEAQ